jgi:hypothetical protein
MLKTKSLTIDATGRDHGKVFLITEMPAMRVEGWAQRLLKGLGRAGVEIDDESMGSGVMALVAIGAKALTQLDWSDAEPLLAEMLSCAQIVPDPARPQVARPIIESDIEEVATLLKLRSEIVEVHVGFSIAAALSILGAAAKERKSSDTPTSHSSSEPSSEPGSPLSTS